ncbi:hypothetical protein ACI7RC_12900 [Brevibacillus sp. B_LB10_24]|uniref:hypothetical protein n=1 Tax=Brevibacillus sp. B_LB10_24 TaxID=3380645 RepID=UPI0038B89A00
MAEKRKKRNPAAKPVNLRDIAHSIATMDSSLKRTSEVLGLIQSDINDIKLHMQKRNKSVLSLFSKNRRRRESPERQDRPERSEKPANSKRPVMEAQVPAPPQVRPGTGASRAPQKQPRADHSNQLSELLQGVDLTQIMKKLQDPKTKAALKKHSNLLNDSQLDFSKIMNMMKDPEIQDLLKNIS